MDEEGTWRSRVKLEKMENAVGMRWLIFENNATQ